MTIDCAYDELVELHKLQPNPKNYNTHPARQIEMLAKIIDYQGQRSPIVVSRRSGFIVKGHGRLDAIKKLGWEKAAVDYQDYSDEAQEYADMIADNKIAELAAADDQLLETLVIDLGEDFDHELLGLEEKLDVFDKSEPGCDEDDVPEVTESISKLGDVYELGDHRLICGDSTDADTVARLMNGQKADMVFTDPPYGVNYEGGHFHSGDVKIKRKREKLANDGDAEIYKKLCPVVADNCNGPCYMWFADCKGDTIFSAVSAVGEIHAMIIWHKTNATYAAMNAQYKVRHEPCLYWKPKGKTLSWCGSSKENTLWEMKKESSNKLHPTQKPVELAERAIRNHTAKTVLDLFGGSGSTLIACEKTGRKCYMMELDPHYIDVIVTRWCKYANKSEIKRNGEPMAWTLQNNG